MGQYGQKGLYSGYNKNNKEREENDYYASPSKEITHLLNNLHWDLNNKIILEPCCGQGHIIKGIQDYCTNCSIIGTDLVERELIKDISHDNLQLFMGEKYDLLDKNYSFNGDIVIFNPPYKDIHLFVSKILALPNVKKIALLGRVQFSESEKRYNSIFKFSPPTDIYQYVDRISCYKNGDENSNVGQQSYNWFIWDREKDNQIDTIFHWIRRLDKEEK